MFDNLNVFDNKGFILPSSIYLIKFKKTFSSQVVQPYIEMSFKYKSRKSKLTMGFPIAPALTYLPPGVIILKKSEKLPPLPHQQLS